MTPPKTEQWLKQDIAEAEEWWCGLQTQSISNPGGQAIPPLTRASHRELLTPLQSPLPESPPPVGTITDQQETKKTLTPLFTTGGSEERDSTDSTSQHISKKEDLDIWITFFPSVEEQDPFKRLLTALKNSLRLKKSPQIEEMSEDKKPLGSRLKVEPEAEEARISTTMPVQEAKKFLREVLLYITLNPKTFTTDRTKKLFLLSYMTDGPGEFWKNEKMDSLLALDAEAEKVTWREFIEDFKTSFEPLDTALEAQMKLRDLKMKERADEYTYQFTYLAKQTGYNDTAQIKAFKQGLLRSLMLKVMT
ncbi:hypothetical protein Moror_13411 [Moniliophthora roreri MCA 2997]|uniref:Retrotransposon gag domain-containing protein n=1 Tax=Moniliophthora roreri (strain MCA 2997) TaxID=1381753 RepID=V2W5G6_MONRO|nr:hypothetical protein Moror_13411 [Moniliophthora roreri MCA 2997]